MRKKKSDRVWYAGAVLVLIVLVMLLVEHTIVKWKEEEKESRLEVWNEIASGNIVNYEVEEEQKRRAYLTFDDGPSPNTDRILDILKEKGAKATFFVVGKTGEKAKARYLRIVEEGHTLAMHSYSHEYGEIYQSMDQYKEDLLKLKEYLEDLTGEEMWLYRFPGGSSNSVSKIPVEDCISFLNQQGITYFDWNASSEDAVQVNAGGNKLNENILNDALRFQSPVILMHDLYECNGTVDGLGALIDRLRQEGYEIVPITRETEPVQHVKIEG